MRLVCQNEYWCKNEYYLQVEQHEVSELISTDAKFCDFAKVVKFGTLWRQPAVQYHITTLAEVSHCEQGYAIGD